MLDKKFSTRLLKAAVYLFVSLLVVYAILFSTGNKHIVRALSSTYLVGLSGPSIYDQSKFTNRSINNSPKVYEFEASQQQIELSQNDLDSIRFWETKSLIIIKNDSIRYQSYFNSTDESTKSNSFSVAKSLVSIAIGVALKQGKISSLNSPIENYITDLKGLEMGKVTVKQLLEMNSGIDFGENYGDPFGFMAKAYYGKELFNLTTQKPVKFKAGSVWEYQGGNTLLLSFILKNATGVNLSNYFEKEVWSKIGTQYSAEWTIAENDSLERAYCCFYSSAIDLAKIGRLYLNYGNWNGEQIIDTSYVLESIKPQNIFNENEDKVDYYGLHWWLAKYKGEAFYYARGILGQYIVIFPNQNLIIVRQGHKRDNTKGVVVPKDLYLYLKIASRVFD